MNLGRCGSRPPSAGDRVVRVRMLIGRALRGDSETLRLCFDDVVLILCLGHSVQSFGNIQFLGKRVVVA